MLSCLRASFVDRTGHRIVTILLQSAWLRKKVLGAMSHCEKKKLYKKCPYDGTRKYLVQVSDRVECLSCIWNPSAASCIDGCAKAMLVWLHVGAEGS